MTWEDKVKMVKHLNKGEYDEAVKFFDEHKDDIDNQALDMFVTGFDLRECEKLKPIKDLILRYDNIESDSIRSSVRLEYMIEYLKQN